MEDKENNNIDKITNISIFDFDGTLIDTMTPEQGKKIYKEKTGKEWKYKGWWGKIESLSKRKKLILLSTNVLQ